MFWDFHILLKVKLLIWYFSDIKRSDAIQVLEVIMILFHTFTDYYLEIANCVGLWHLDETTSIRHCHECRFQHELSRNIASPIHLDIGVLLAVWYIVSDQILFIVVVILGN